MQFLGKVASRKQFRSMLVQGLFEGVVVRDQGGIWPQRGPNLGSLSHKVEVGRVWPPASGAKQFLEIFREFHSFWMKGHIPRGN
jgi:hypothetical protein